MELSLPATSLPVTTRGETAAAAALPPALLRRRPAGDGVDDGARGTGLGLARCSWASPPLLLSLRGRRLRAPRRRAAKEAPSDLRSAEAALDEPAAIARARSRSPVRARPRGRRPRGRRRRRARGPRHRRARPAAGPPVRTGRARDRRREPRGRGARGGPAARRLAPRVARAGRRRARAARRSRASAGWRRRILAPETLYESGALRAAADGFGRRAGDAPAVADHWYNLGATYYRLGATGRAEAAWLRARRLAPREPAVRRALR